MSMTDRAAIRRMLDHLSELAEDASLTGKLRDGAPDAVRKYNAILTTLRSDHDLPAELFEPLPLDAGWDRLGVDAHLLSGFLEGDDNGKHRHLHGGQPGDVGALVALAPFLNSDDLARLIEERIADGLPFDEGVLIALAPFVGSDALGRMLRNRLRRARGPESAPGKPVVPATPEAPVAPPSPDVHAVVTPEPTIAPDPLIELEAEAGRHARRDEPDLETLLTSLRDPALQNDRRQEILDQIAVVMATRQD